MRCEMSKRTRMVAIGGSDAGISAALRARELEPEAAVTVIAADAHPNFSICGIPYYLSGEVGHWRKLAHRSVHELDAAGMRLLLDSTVTAIDADGRRLAVRDRAGKTSFVDYDSLGVSCPLSVRGRQRPDLRRRRSTGCGRGAAAATSR
jgi:NADPH-dependent 2,4-dienoyl-CoA reductase/sulfur reductase-like enzyme